MAILSATFDLRICLSVWENLDMGMDMEKLKFFEAVSKKDWVSIIKLIDNIESSITYNHI